MPNRTHRRLALIGAVAALAVVVWQGAVSMPVRMADGGGPLPALVFYFSYLGVVVAVGQALVWAASARVRPLVPALAGPTARVAMAGAGLAVLVLHAPLLAAGMQGGIAELLMHYALPVAFVAWWAIGPHPVPLRWSRVVPMLALPVLYALWVLVRGVTIGRWPYPFVSVPDLGWSRVLLNLGGLILVFALVDVAMIAAARFLHARARFGILAR
jgi:hypothetical protein